MSLTLVAGASPALPVAGRGLDARAIAADTRLAAALRGVLAALVLAARDPGQELPSVPGT